MPNRTSALTPRQRRFVDYYLASENPTEAATLAGYKRDGAIYTGQRLLAIPAIAQEINREISARWKNMAVDGDRVLGGFARFAFHAFPDHIKLRALDKLALYFRLYGPKAPAAAPETSRFTEENYAKARAALKERVEKILAERDDNAASVAVYDTGTPM